MKIKLNPEQLSYLKSLDSKKKKRKFLLDCLVEEIEFERTETQKINDLFFKELEAKRESLLSDVKKLFSDYESKEQGISVLCDLSKIGFFIDEDVLDKYHESAKKK